MDNAQFTELISELFFIFSELEPGRDAIEAFRQASNETGKANGFEANFQIKDGELFW